MNLEHVEPFSDSQFDEMLLKLEDNECVVIYYLDEYWFVITNEDHITKDIQSTSEEVLKNLDSDWFKELNNS